MSISKNVLFSLITAAVFFAVTEVSFRIIYGPPRASHDDIIAEATTEGHTLLSNIDRTHAGASIRTNELGLRDPRSPHKLQDGTQILVLGDSFTFGWGVEIEQSYPSQLERLLNEENGQTRHEVINAGVPGYNTVHELALLEKIIGRYSPRWIVIGFHTEDLKNHHERFHDQIQREKESGPVHAASVKPTWMNDARKEILSLANRSSFVAFLIKYYKTSFIRFIPPPEESLRNAGDFLNPLRFQATKIALKEIHAIAKANDAELLLFMIVPLINWEAYPYGGLHEGLAVFCEENGIGFVDPLPEFSKYDAGTLWVALNDGHYSPQANAIAARTLCDYLLRMEKMESTVVGHPGI
jgi:hypothetical protein